MLLISILLLVALVTNLFCPRKTNAFDVPHTMPLRGMLAMFVISCHVVPFLDDGFIKTDLGNMGAPSVSCFFFLSGYGLAQSFLVKGQSYLDDFFTKRLSKLLVPFLLSAAIYWTCQSVLGEFSLVNVGRQLAKGGGVTMISWFIEALVVCYLLFYVAFRFTRNKRMAFCGLCLATLLLSTFTHFAGWRMWTHDVWCFPMGAGVALYGKKLIPAVIGKGKCKDLLTVLLPTLYGCIGCHIHYLPGWWTVFCLCFPVVVMLVLRYTDISGVRWLAWLGAYSYEIYLTHDIMLYVFTHYTETAWIIILGNFVASILAAPVLKTVSSKILHRFNM